MKSNVWPHTLQAASVVAVLCGFLTIREGGAVIIASDTMLDRQAVPGSIMSNQLSAMLSGPALFNGLPT